MKADPAFRQMYESEFARVFRTVFLLCKDRATAEDATQEAFIRALERWARLKDEPWVAGWVTSTAVNMVKRSLRRRPVLRPSDDTEEDPDTAIDVWRGIRRLPLRQQQAVVLYYGGDLSVGEVARIMECEEGTIRAHLAKARQALRKHLGGGLDAE